jgi:hypothetical protein
VMDGNDEENNSSGWCSRKEADPIRYRSPYVVLLWQQ